MDDPENGLAGLEVVFTAPPNDEVGEIAQPVPLTGRGVALRPAAVGLPFTEAGEWTVPLTAQTDAGVINTVPQSFTILNEDGTPATAALTIPPSIVVTIPATTEGS